MPKQKAIDKLRDSEVLALAIWITQHSRSWRSQLLAAYEAKGRGVAGYVPALEQIRTRLGASILDSLDPGEVLKAGELVRIARGIARWRCVPQSEKGAPLAPAARGCGHLWDAPLSPPPTICPECLNPRTEVRRIGRKGAHA